MKYTILDDVVIDHENHVYMDSDGNKSDFSVTEVINGKNKFTNQKIQTAAAVGRLLHHCFAIDMIETLDDEKYLSSIDDPVRYELIQSMLKYFNHSKIKDAIFETPRMLEINHNNKTYRIGGTADMVFSYLGKRIVIDLKTGNANSVKAEWRTQLAVYMLMYGADQGYILLPGTKPIIAVVDNNHYLDSFWNKLTTLIAETDKNREGELSSEDAEHMDEYIKFLMAVDAQKKELSDALKACELKRNSVEKLILEIVQKNGSKNISTKNNSINFVVSTRTGIDTEKVNTLYPECCLLSKNSFSWEIKSEHFKTNISSKISDNEEV